MDIQIESGIEIPPKGTGQKKKTINDFALVAWKKMRIGDSFVLEDSPKILARVRASIQHHCRYNGAAITIRKLAGNKETEAWRFWKIRKPAVKSTASTESRVAATVKKYSSESQPIRQAENQPVIVTAP